MPELDFAALTSDYFIPWGIKIAQALLIFVVGRIVVGIVMGVIEKMLNRSQLDVMLVSFVCSILRFVLLLVVIVAALNALNVNTTSLVALIGAAGLAIGLALQSSLQNFSAGALLVFFKPIARGEFVDIAGVAGTVEDIRIFHTTLKTPDNKEVIVPNGEIFGAVIVNYSRRPTRRVDMVFGIGYDDDIRKAREILERIVTEDKAVLDDPAPVVALDELGDSSVNFVVRPWVNTADYWAVKWRVTEHVKEAFDAAGISIPYPQMDVHLHRSGSEPG
jgi:small conductance mechanosensitive channel